MGLFNGNQFPYTNFHEMNLDWIAERIEQAAGIADGLADRVTDAEAAINTLDQRVTADDQLIAGNTSQIATHTSQIAGINQDITTLNSRVTTETAALDQRITTETSALDQRITTETSALDDRITSNSDAIDLLETRVSTAESDIDTLETNVADKSTVEVEQILSGGVRVGTITVDGTATTLFAPTAGSTVVRAEDVPFNNSNVVPAMSAVDCQEAIEEVNTNTGALDTRLTTAEGNITTLQSNLTNLAAKDVDYTADPAMWAVYDSSTVYNPQDVQTALDLLANDLFQGAYTLIKRDIFYEWIEGTAADTITEPIVSLPFSGMITTQASEIYFFVPYTKIWNRYAINPIDNAQQCQFSLTGTVTVRGVNGYIINTKSVADSSIQSINVNAMAQGYQMVIKLATAASTTNNTPVSVYFQNNAKLTISVPRT